MRTGPAARPTHPPAASRQLEFPGRPDSCSIRAVPSPTSPAPPPAVSRLAVLVAGGLIVLAGLAAYHNSFAAPFVFDGPPSILENPTIRHLWPIWPVLWPPPELTVGGRPFVNLTLAVNRAISGEAVWSYHAFNLAIHLLAGLVLFGLVRRTLSQPALRTRFGADALPLAGAVAGLWLLHPLQTESVTYVIQRAESLAGLFYLVTLYGFIRATERPAGAARSGISCAWLGLSFAACLLGVATKEVLVSAPLLVLLYDRTFVAGDFRSALRSRGSYYFALAATWILLGCLVAGTGNRGGTAGFGTTVSPGEYALTQCEAVALYLKLSFWPHPLVFDYGVDLVHQVADVWPQAVLLSGLLAATAWALGRRPVLGFMGLWIFAILAPSSSVVPIATQTMAEHRMYLPLAAVVTLAVAGLYGALGRRSLVLWPLLALALGWLTVRRNDVYRSEVALWSDTVARRPFNARAHYDLGLAYSEQKQFAPAVREYAEALRLDPAGDKSGHQAHVIEAKLGHHLVVLGRLPEAVTHYQSALRLKPDYALAHHNLAEALVQLDRYPEAIVHFETALRLNLGGAETPARLGHALLHEGRAEEAIQVYRAALRLEPTAAPGHNNLAYALLVTGRVAESIREYREALRLGPRSAAASAGLGYALIQAGRPAEAIAPCEQAVRLQPDYAAAHRNLAEELERAGRKAEAENHFAAAARLEAEENAARTRTSQPPGQPGPGGM